MSRLKLTILGSGTSMGVPTLGCHCAVCTSTDARDKRTRPSILLEYDGRCVLIDTTPDFRFQALRVRLERLDAVLYTHGHADHVLGLDDIRPFNAKQGAPIPIYGSGETLATLRKQFSYIFDPSFSVSSLPQVLVHEVHGTMELFGLKFVPIHALHGSLPVLGFRFGKGAYLTDFSVVPDASKTLLRDLDHFILDALRYRPHPMHSTVEQSLALVAELKPAHAWFTHICHDLGHVETNAKLPEGVQLAYDGLQLEVEV
ncbi:MAG TPA: MBL fold metallo-hydrolase [Candidatus Acidoferrales bacterium]|nr:MBL fold metallo-hydrolase [Candidatus Acidoferrales bacterium]